MSDGEKSLFRNIYRRRTLQGFGFRLFGRKIFLFEFRIVRIELVKYSLEFWSPNLQRWENERRKNMEMDQGYIKYYRTIENGDIVLYRSRWHICLIFFQFLFSHTSNFKASSFTEWVRSKKGLPKIDFEHFTKKWITSMMRGPRNLKYHHFGWTEGQQKAEVT